MLLRNGKNYKKSIFLKNDIKRYTAVTSFRNTINNDQIIDYLSLLNSKDKTIDKKTLEIISKKDFDNIKSRKTSFEYIVKEGNKFEKNVMNELINRMKINNEMQYYLEICGKDKKEKAKKTENALLLKKYNVITGGVVYDEIKEIYGIPDLIVKGKFIKKYFCDDYENKYKSIEIGHDKNNKKRKLSESFDNTKENINKKRKKSSSNNKSVIIDNEDEEYFNEIKRNIEGNYLLENEINDNLYYVIDIKNSSLPLISHGKSLSKANEYNFYRFQLYCYNECIKYMFKKNKKSNDVNKGYLLGRKYSTTIKKESLYFGSFENLGTVLFDKEILESYENKCKEGKKWLYDLRTKYCNFSLNPINRKELHPNMKNEKDEIYHELKKHVANKNREITLLYRCNINKRNACLEMGIARTDDKRLNCKILGFENSKYELIIDGMLSLENSDDKIIIDKNVNNYMEWQEKVDYEFYVDFETYDINTDKSCDKRIIYMIGVYFRNEFRCFIINKDFEIEEEIKKMKNDNKKINCETECYIFCENEYELINKFREYILSKKNVKCSNECYFKNLRLIHWSDFERQIFVKKVYDYKLNKKEFNFNWYDLLKVFNCENSPIVIKDCFNYKLKNVVNKMKKHDFIDIEWSDLEDGLLSSLMAKKIYEENEEDKNNFIVDITEYNCIDCKSLYEILNFIREIPIKN